MQSWALRDILGSLRRFLSSMTLLILTACDGDGGVIFLYIARLQEW